MKSRTKVLIVEDEPIIAADADRKLRRLDYEVLAIASDAEEGFLAAAATQPDVVLMDIDLKGSSDGIEAATKVYSELQIPVVFMTAHDDMKTLRRAQEAEPFGYMTKPVASADLANSIEVAVRRHHKQNTQQVREHWLEAQLMSVGEGLVAANHDGTIWFINPEAERLLGVSGADIIGSSFRSAIPLRDRVTGEAAPDLVRLAFLQGAITNIGENYVVDGPGHRQIAGEMAISRFGGEPIGIVFTFRDSTVQNYSQTVLQNKVVKGEGLDCSRAPVSLHQLLCGMEAELRKALSPAIKLNISLDESVHAIDGNRNILKTIVKELVGRAGEKLENEGNIYISTMNLDFERRQMDGSISHYVRLRIAYQSTGTPVNSKPIQTRHYRGTSIDFSMAAVQSAVQALGATAHERSSRLLNYWDIDFPAVDSALACTNEDVPSAVIVLIEPDAAVRSALCEYYLTNNKVECFGARDAQEALDWVRMLPGQIDVVILPEAEYCSTIQTLLNESPATSLLFVTRNVASTTKLLQGISSTSTVVDHLFSHELLRDKLAHLLRARADHQLPQAETSTSPQLPS
ncbi:MAG TPA: response regulator [Bryobacteraceae bacterium]|jgi:DNA-binding NarL/FixJ family response regulator